MKQLQAIVLAAVATVLTMLMGASTASATTLEVNGVPKNEALTFNITLTGSMLLTDTFGSFANTCTASTKEGKTEAPFSASRVGGGLSVLSFTNCTEDAKEHIVVDAAGVLSVEAISGTTNGTVFSSGAKVTSPSPFGRLTCTTASTGTDIGKVTGVKAGKATMDISAVLNCGIITTKWSATYLVTSPEGLGITS